LRILPRKPLGIGDRAFLAAVGVLYLLRAKLVGRKYLHIARAGRADFADFAVVVNRPAGLGALVLVDHRAVPKQRDQNVIRVSD